MSFIIVQVGYPFNSINTATAWKKSSFIHSERSDFLMIGNLSIEVHAFARCMLIWLSVDEILLPRGVYISRNFGGLLFKMEMVPSCLTHTHTHIHIYIYYCYCCCCCYCYYRYCYYYFTILTVLHASIFHRGLSDKSLQVSGTLLNNTVVWMVSTRPLITKSSRPWTNPLVTVPSAPITTLSCFIVFFQFSSNVKVLNSLFAFVIIILLQREFFHASISWSSSTGVWVIASLLTSLGLFSVFWPILIMLWLDGLNLCSYFQFLQSLYQTFGDSIERNVIFMFHSFFSSLAWSK